MVRRKMDFLAGSLGELILMMTRERRSRTRKRRCFHLSLRRDLREEGVGRSLGWLWPVGLMNVPAMVIVVLVGVYMEGGEEGERGIGSTFE